MSDSKNQVNVRRHILSFGPKGEFLLDCIDREWRLIRMRRVMWKGGVPYCTCKLGADCKAIGKHPDGKWGSPLDPNDPRTLLAILVRLKQDPTAGWGVHLGLSDLESMDVDTKGDGLANWRKLQADRGLTHLEPFTQTGSDGLHYLFRRSPNCDQRKGWMGPNGATSCCAKFPGLGDWCSGQHFIVLPGSIHWTGNFYQKAGGPIYEATPAALADFVNTHDKFTSAAKIIPVAPIAGYTAAAVDGDMKDRRIRAFLAERGPAVSNEGGHNKTLSIANAILIGFDCTPDETLAHLSPWNETCRPPWSLAELQHKVDDAPTLGGERGSLLNAPYERPLSAEEIWLRDVRLRIHWGRTILITGPNNTLAGKEYAPGWDPKDIDLGDLAAAADVAEGLDATDPSLVDRGDGPLLTAEVHASAAAADDRPPCQSCPKPDPVYQEIPGTTQKAIRYFACDLLSCVFCGPLKTEHWVVWMRHWLLKERDKRGTDSEPLYLFECDPDDWRSRIAPYIREKGGNYFWVDRWAIGRQRGPTILVLSTVLPLDVEHKPVTPEDGLAVLKSSIEAVDPSARCQVFGHSRRWADPDPKDKKPLGWKTVCRLSTPELCHERVLDAHGIDFRYSQSPNRFRQWRAIFFQVEKKLDKVVLDDLSEGTPMGCWSARNCHESETEEPDEWGPVPNATPPPSAGFVVELH